jgi:hypothetical protein
MRLAELFIHGKTTFNDVESMGFQATPSRKSHE